MTNTGNATLLATFPGKYGDILACLPTLKVLNRNWDVTLGVMPTFGKIIPLVKAQSYIKDCVELEGWEMVDDACGARPRVPGVVPMGFDSYVHLGYKDRPDAPLCLYIARQAGVDLEHPVLPFLETRRSWQPGLVAYAFNEMHTGAKQVVFDAVFAQKTDWDFVDVTKMPFLEAAQAIAHSSFYFGCRSSCYVIAHGLNVPTLVYEPDAGRRGAIFSWPWGKEALFPMPSNSDDPLNLRRIMRIAESWAEKEAA